MKRKKVACIVVWAIICSLAFCGPTPAQTVLASVTGRVLDPNAAVIVEVTVAAKNVDTGIETTVHTNEDGIYHFADLGPGSYEFSVSKRGFKVIVKPGVTIHVADTISMNFNMQVGDIRETVTVEAGAPLINTESAAVSTVVDRQFAENLPLNGRSFQTLIQLTPGVVLTPSNGEDSGQFSVNGQRAASNYWMVDGVSANIGVNANLQPGSGLAGSVGGFTAQGGTNSLVSVDALQEFRIQTSTYAPEFGRTPGGQISIVTRSGTNQFRGTVFNYLRNDVFDANDWFSNEKGLPKARERQNDFGGVIGGPILKDKTFFFFSYEGLRLRLPQTKLTNVPDASFTPGGTTNSRQTAIPAMQPYLNAFPLPNRNSPEIFTPCDPAMDPTCPPSGQKATGFAALNASYSNPATLDAYSIRVDHRIGDKFTLFGRYNYSPSETVQRGSSVPLSQLDQIQITTHTATIGSTWAISPQIVNDLRFNYSRVNSSDVSQLDNFGGAVPLTSLGFPSPFTTQSAVLVFNIVPLGALNFGRNLANLQRQINVVDNFSLQKSTHSLKFGIDFRRLSPERNPAVYVQDAMFSDVPSAAAGNLVFGIVQSALKASLLFRNLGVFAQDTWRVVPRLTVTYGLRWDLDFAPSTTSGPSFPAAIGFNLNDLSNLALAPAGTPAFKTPYGNVAPRVGIAYQLSPSSEWQTVFRGGFGVFYDLASEQAGNFFQRSYPFAGLSVVTGQFPLSAASAAPPPITPANLASPFGALAAFDPNLQLPYTLEWNIALEQAIGQQQTISASYVGASGRRLIQTTLVAAPNPNLGAAHLVANLGASEYNALQLQFQRRLSHGLQALASYTWSHSIDDGSAGSSVIGSNISVPGTANQNRGPSDFDIRNSFSAGVTYDIPAPKMNALTNALLRGWSLENVIQVRSAPPVSVSDGNFNLIGLFQTDVRPNVVPGIPLYLHGSQYAGGKIINNTPGAVAGGCPDGSQSIGPFCPPPTDPNTGLPLGQGNLGRNALRGFGAAQWDVAVHREFPIHESLKLQFRAELFNALNHPNFGAVDGDISSSTFGQSRQMLGQSLELGSAGAGLSSLYQLGGPRSIQFALKLQF